MATTNQVLGLGERMMSLTPKIAVVLGLVVGLVGCRGNPSSSAPSISGEAIDAREVHAAYSTSDLKGDEKYGKGAFVKIPVKDGWPNVERRTNDGRYFIAVDLGKEFIRPDWEGYGVICTDSQAKLLKTTGLKVKIKKVSRSHPPGGSEGLFVIMEAVD